MKKDPQRGATNTDGTWNMRFCIYCYQKGAFTFSCQGYFEESAGLE